MALRLLMSIGDSIPIAFIGMVLRNVSTSSIPRAAFSLLIAETAIEWKVCLPVCLSVCLSVRLSVCLFVYLSVYLSLG